MSAVKHLENGRFSLATTIRGRARWRGKITSAARLIIAGLFVTAAIPKFIAPANFALIVYRYHILPDNWVNATALLVPWLEVVAAFALLFLPSWHNAAFLLTSALLFTFTAALAAARARGINLACGCFSLDGRVGPVGWGPLLRDATLLLALLAIWRVSRRDILA